MEFFKIVMPAVDDPDSPCCGHVGGDWHYIDLHLYTSVDWDELKNKLLYNTFTNWNDSYPLSAEVPERIITIQPGYAEVTADKWHDKIRFSDNGKYIVTLRGFSFSDTESVLVFWAHTGLKETVAEIPFWVGRFGDWRNVTAVSDDYHVWNTEPAFSQVLNGRPSYFFHGQDAAQNDAIYLVQSTSEACTTWVSPVELCSNVKMHDFKVINGVPVVLYYDVMTSFFYSLYANNAGGTSWPLTGEIVPKAVRGAGTHTGAQSDKVLVDVSASFESNSVEEGDWVELAFSRCYARVLSVDSETQLTTTSLSDEDTYDGGDAYTVFANDRYNMRQCRLGVVNGCPALVYNRGPGGPQETYFVLAKDWQGLDWYEPVYVGDIAGTLTDIQNVGGNPGFGSYRYEYGFYFHRANDPVGQSWISSGPFGEADDVRSFAAIDGAPAICYCVERESSSASPNETYDELWYARADDEWGSSWSFSTVIGTALDYAYYNYMEEASLAAINGIPAVAFYQQNGNLAYIQAKDEYGNNWNEVVEVDSGLSHCIALIQLGNDPAVFYSNAVNPEVRFSVPEL